MKPVLAVLLLFLALMPAVEGEEKEYPISRIENEAVLQLEGGRFVKARETAQNILNADPNSFVALYILGIISSEAEGNLPRAHFYLQRAKEILESRWGEDIPLDGPWKWHNKVLWGMISVAGDMDRRQEQLDLLRLHDRLYQPEATASYGWPLMKLGRIEEGRNMMAKALKSEDAWSRWDAMNTLGAMETENDQPDRAYQVFTDLLREVEKAKAPMNVTFLRNSGSAALTLQKYEEGERLLIEATRHFEAGTFSDPWKDLARLYLSQGRFPEALSAVREMQAWSHTKLPSREQQSWADRQTVTSALLDECGFNTEALSLMRRIMNRPDRRGGTSIHSDQSEAGNLVLFRHLLKIYRERLSEEMSWESLPKCIMKWFQRLSASAEIWTAGRRAAGLTLGNHRLAASVRFYAPDSIDVLDPARPELIDIFGAGVVGVEAGRLLNGTGPGLAREKPLLLLMLGESELNRGMTAQARRTLESSVSSIPKAEVLLRARAEALLGKACETGGDWAMAMNHYQQALQKGPNVLRSLGIALPVIMRSSGGAMASLAASMLKKSPRFDDINRGFMLSVLETASGLSGTLSAPDGTILCQASTSLDQDPIRSARAFCAEFHRRAFAAKVDLAQTDIASLEGSNLTGDAVRGQLQNLFQK
jgi:tetratricopeptide (TPR) repeat protein